MSSIGKGPKHGKVNKKSGMPFHCELVPIYSKGSRAQFYTKSHFETMEPSNGFEPNIVQNVCLVSIMVIHTK